MELPIKYRKLYKHWANHTHLPTNLNQQPLTDSQLLTDLVYFINERLHIYEQKESGKSKPYTDDQILCNFRFCNIYRELDRQTVFYHELLKPLEGNVEEWLLNMLFCRSICNTETVQEIGKLTFYSENNDKALQKLRSLESPKYGTAYIFPISVIQKSKWNTRELFFCKYYPTVIKKMAAIINTFSKISVTEALAQILPVFGFNLKFLWTEVLIDIAYQFPDKIDLFRRFPIGPGALPTLRRINSHSEHEQTNLSLVGVLDDKLNLLTIDGKKVILSAENWEGIGCEYRKYTNLKLGNGRKRLYH
jgi:hypothetical protein